MKKKILFPIAFAVLGIVAAVSLYFTVKEFVVYMQNENTADVQTEETSEAIDVNKTLTYENPNAKHRENAIEQIKYFGYQHMYKKDDIYFLSTTKNWDEEKLEALAEELYDNKHAEEINYLKMVVVNGSSSGYAAGTHTHTTESYAIPAGFYAFLPEEAVFNSHYKMSSIYLYGAGPDTTAADLALVMSHEYGHHFTFYHFGLTNSEEDKETEYYKIRAAEYENQVILERDYLEDYLDLHQWYLAEIAAEDYVNLMGSKNAKRIVDFYDNMDRFYMFYYRNYNKLLEYFRYTELCINGVPHENIQMKIPAYVDGLIEYYYSFVEDEPPYTSPAEDIGTLNLQMKELNGGTRHDFSWDQPYTDPDVVYTLIGYDMDDNIIMMLKTTTGDEKGDAGLGIYTIGFGTYEQNLAVDERFDKYHAYDGEEGTEMKFRVSIVFPDGKILLSDPIIIVY